MTDKGRAKPDRKPAPWEKELVELTKHDWQIAVGLSHDHKHSPLQIRVAFILMHHADPKTMLAWPTQESVAEYVGVAEERQVRRAILALCESGAVKRCRISQLDEAERDKITRSKRGVVYRLNLYWAWEILEASTKPLAAEPKQLRDARRRKETPSGIGGADRTTAVLSERTTTVRYMEDYDSPPNEEGINIDQKREAPREESLASTREVSAYALASGRAG